MKLKHILAIMPLAFGAGYGCEEGFIFNPQGYEVNGNTCEEAKADMEGKGYTIDGKWRAGKADVGLSFEPLYTPQPQQTGQQKRFCCKAVIGSLTAKCNANIYLPQWNGSDKCWDRFIDALTLHEMGHVEICNDYADKLKNAIIGLDSIQCSEISPEQACNAALDELEQKANEAYDTVSAEHNTAQDAYDTGNNHGERQGATLNCNCE